MATFEALPDEVEATGTCVVDAAFQVWRVLGPGLLESAYKAALETELVHQGCRIERDVPLAITYRTRRIERAYFMDLVVNDAVVVELKSTLALHESHDAQILTYLKLSGRPLGYLINFGDPYFKRGIRRFVNAPRRSPPPPQTDA